MTKAKAARLTLAEAAEYLGMPAEDLQLTRWKGIAPGNLGYKVGGVLYFDRDSLPKPKAKKAAGPADAAEEEAPE